MSKNAEIIEAAFAEPQAITPQNVAPELKAAILTTIEQLDRGQLRIAEKKTGQWQVNQSAKKAVLLSFRLYDNQILTDGVGTFYDKIPLKYTHYQPDDFQAAAVRVVPQAMVRHGSYIASNCVLMPSFVNIGAYIDAGTMIDTWASVGSCAQIGKNVHLSGGVGIGGVLEPLQANPTIIEDNCFIGARSEIVEGVIVEENSVLSMGVYLSQSTRIYDRATQKILYGRVPAGSVVVPGTLPAADGSHHLYAAIIVKQVDAKTRAKTSINELLRSVE